MLEEGLENLDTENVEPEIIGDVLPQESITGESQYTPNYKFKVMDDEFEFDEKIRSAITSKEVEEHLRDLYTKSHGIPKLKETIEKTKRDYDEVQSKYSRTETEYGQLREGIDKLGQLSQKDFGLFRRTMNIPEDIIIDHAEEILRYRNADSDEQRRLDQLQQEKLNGYQSQNEAERLRRENSEFQKFRLQYELDHALGTSDISDFAKKFDTKMGGDAFKRKVVNYGATYWNQHRQFISPADACKAVIGEYGVFFADGNTAPTSQQSTTREAPKPIPNLGSGSTVSPTMKKFKSIDDIRKLSDQMEKERISHFY